MTEPIHALQFITTIQIDRIGYNELLKNGYSQNQITSYIQNKIEYAFDLTKLGIASESITLEPAEDFTIIRKREPIQFSSSTSEDVSSVITIKKEVLNGK